MPLSPSGSVDHDAVAARRGDARTLALALKDSRRDTLATFEAYLASLGQALQVPWQAGLNPPLWELGHIGWFQEFWIARNPQRAQGVRADPDAPRRQGVRPGADALYNSSRVPHADRWHLPLPDADSTRADLEAQLQATLQALPVLGDDRSLYFHRLALFHEDMHHEAALYMARRLDIPIVDGRWQPPQLVGPRRALPLPAAVHRLGRHGEGEGFVFDNEVPPQTQAVPAFEIDSRVLNWAELLPFVEAGGYADRRWWSDAGWHWVQQRRAQAPLNLRRDGGVWLQRRAAGWQPLDLAQAAEHLSAFEAEAWCRWAGRRLPTEAEWERAAHEQPQDFAWGTVWEWTASPFEPRPGFVPHPYRDYSQPWFDGRPVLRGASYLTQPRLRHRGYRNFFTADRNDIVAGLRSCALRT